jgi:tetratricopeptide (TPR) repeat protein
MCEVAHNRDRFADMLNYAERILQIAPDNPDGLVWKGTALGRLGKPNDAAALLEQGTSSPAVTATALTRAAHYYFYWSPNRAWKNRALSLLERALVLKPDDPAALNLLAQYRLDENRCGDAVGIATRLTEISPKDSNSWVTLGNAYWCLGDKTRAKENYLHAIQITPSLERTLRDRLNAP